MLKMSGPLHIILLPQNQLPGLSLHGRSTLGPGRRSGATLQLNPRFSPPEQSPTQLRCLKSESMSQAAGGKDDVSGENPENFS